MTVEERVLIVGAGVAGLSLARRLAQLGRSAVVLDKGRGVGGRCATRRVDGVPVDHGVPLLHGGSRPLRAALRAAGGGATTVHDWPLHVEGLGTPCQPQAYRADQQRLAFAEGVSAFPKWLARELTVELEQQVEGIALAGEQLQLQLAAAARRAATVVLSCPVPQTLALLDPLAREHREVEGLVAALRRVFVLPCLTLIAGYAAPAPSWDLFLPPADSPIHSLIHDSSKRTAPAETRLVIQARARFSREHLDSPTETWAAQLLAAAAALAGDWAAAPRWQQTHSWRFARVQRGSELSHPALLRFRDGALLGLCGEAFNPAGGVEGAYLSGLELAQRIAWDAATPADGQAARTTTD